MLVDFGKSSLLSKAHKQPEKVKQVLNKIKTDGFWTTIDTVSTKLNQPIPLGYRNAGVILDIGEGGHWEELKKVCNRSRMFRFTSAQ